MDTLISIVDSGNTVTFAEHMYEQKTTKTNAAKLEKQLKGVYYEYLQDEPINCGVDCEPIKKGDKAYYHGVKPDAVGVPYHQFVFPNGIYFHADELAIMNIALRRDS